VGQKVRKAIADIGGTMAEDLPPEPSIKPLLEERRRKRGKQLRSKERQDQGGQEKLF
jgi:hypothetical protein